LYILYLHLQENYTEIDDASDSTAEVNEMLEVNSRTAFFPPGTLSIGTPTLKNGVEYEIKEENNHMQDSYGLMKKAEAKMRTLGKPTAMQ
jgi:hypothetical protein